MTIHALPIESAPKDTVVLVFLPWLHRPGNKNVKNNTGWFRAILCKHPRMTYHPQPYRWKVWLYPSTPNFMSAQPKYWAKIDPEHQVEAGPCSLAVH